jgi:hypothetical protein
VTFRPTPENVAESLRWKEEDLRAATLAEQIDHDERRRYHAERDLAVFKETIARFVACSLLCPVREAA